ncbi:B3/B4 domain-containing protein [Pseudonocardia sp. TRM90224]|uniref:B3/B4 domain-containing protein n=1 Tax=Pseudonocardia sp. TRM90224 TaxID=2812678 RepID=UPI0027DF741D|nr:phenylalanine--tRNA ligase beta subunit-related protein [Pseudonocardia sp. TRM90224]
MIEFRHSTSVWERFPQLVPAVLRVEGFRGDNMAGPAVDSRVAAHVARAIERLATTSIAELPEVGSWRRAFAEMGLKPTQYRCASESLLRRLAKHGSLPQVHPLVDLCNAVSVAFAIPVAVLDLGSITGALEVRPASGDERYETFSGEIEHPAPGEIVFVDAAGDAHARRWTNRQSGASAVRADTTDVLIVAEGLHPSASRDVPRLAEVLAAELAELWGLTAKMDVLSREHPTFAA